MSTHLARTSFCIGLLATGLCGCVSPYAQPQQHRQTAEREDLLIVREEMRRLDGRVEGLEMQSDRLREELDVARRDGGRDAETSVAALRSSIAGLEERLAGLEKARQRDREEILNRVSETVAKLVTTSAPPRKKTKPRSSSEYGYEHTVGPGETLSAIAQVYDVTTKTIIEANEIVNPDRLRVGQVLFIPE